LGWRDREGGSLQSLYGQDRVAQPIYLRDGGDDVMLYEVDLPVVTG